METKAKAGAVSDKYKPNYPVSLDSSAQPPVKQIPLFGEINGYYPDIPQWKTWTSTFGKTIKIQKYWLLIQ